MSNGNLRLAFVIDAVDRATATVARINKTIDRLTEPARRVRAAFTGLIRESRFERITDSVDRVHQRFGALQGTLGGVRSMLTSVAFATGGALFGFKGIANEVDAVADRAKLLSITTQELQRLGYAAQMNGSSQDELGEALKFLSKNLTEANNGSKEMVTWFARMGVSQERLKRIGLVELFGAIADKFEQVGDVGQNGAKKIAAMQALLGRSGSSMKQVLDLGSAGIKRFADEADRLGVTLSDETVVAMADFNDGWDRLKATLFGAAANALRAMTPTLDRLLGQLTEWTAANRGLIATRFAEWVDRIVPRLPAIARGLGQVGTLVASLTSAANRFAQAIGGWENLLAAIAGVIGAKMVVQVGLLTASLWSLGAASLANPLGLILITVTALVAALPLLIVHFDKVVEKLYAMKEAAPRWLMQPLENSWFGRTFTSHSPSPQPQGSWDAALPGAGGGRAQVGGTITVKIDQEGRAKPGGVSKSPGSPVDIDAVYTGGLGAAAW